VSLLQLSKSSFIKKKPLKKVVHKLEPCNHKMKIIKKQNLNFSLTESWHEKNESFFLHVPLARFIGMRSVEKTS